MDRAIDDVFVLGLNRIHLIMGEALPAPIGATSAAVVLPPWFLGHDLRPELRLAHLLATHHARIARGLALGTLAVPLQPEQLRIRPQRPGRGRPRRSTSSRKMQSGQISVWLLLLCCMQKQTYLLHRKRRTNVR